MPESSSWCCFGREDELISIGAMEKVEALETSLRGSSETSSTSSCSDMDEKAEYDSSVLTTQLVADKPDVDADKLESHHGGHSPRLNEINSLDRYQMEISLFFLTSVYCMDRFLPQMRPYTGKFLHLQHRYPGTDQYDIGVNDCFFILTGMFLVTFIRAVSMNYLLRPLAKAVGIHKHRATQRFMEQGWYLIYYSISFSAGLYILYYHSDYYNNLDNLYIAWPHDHMSALFKSYYLLEMSCWLQQIFILNIEARRKDHYQMFSHHIITCLLLGGSYYYYFTKIGHVILSIMDVVDIFLSSAKILRYCGFQTMCDVLFGLFVVVWIVLRHGLYNYLFWHAATRAKSLMASGKCLSIEGINHQKRCWTDNVITVFLSLLGGLQIITIIWMYLIVKVLVKVVTGSNAEDVRSDDEDD